MYIAYLTRNHIINNGINSVDTNPLIQHGPNSRLFESNPCHAPLKYFPKLPPLELKQLKGM